MSSLNELSREVIGAAIEVHKTLGPGFLESIYEAALAIELTNRGVPAQRQVIVEIGYKGEPVGVSRLDLLVDGRLIVELKAVDALTSLHDAQVLSYLKALSLQLGLLMNFNSTNLTRTIRRLVLGALPPEGNEP